MGMGKRRKRRKGLLRHPRWEMGDVPFLKNAGALLRNIAKDGVGGGKGWGGRGVGEDLQIVFDCVLEGGWVGWVGFLMGSAFHDFAVICFVCLFFFFLKWDGMG
jgi:hypothetical protein